MEGLGLRDVMKSKTPENQDFSQVAPTTKPAQLDPLLSLRGSGKHLWGNEHADEYVRRLRKGWDGPE
jgi:hypothetical protein